MFTNKKIAFVGAGSMAKSIIKGMLKTERFLPEQIWVSNRSNENTLSALQTDFGVKITRSKAKLIQDASLIVLAVKPIDLKTTLQELNHYLTSKQVIISLAAGMSIHFIAKQLSAKRLPIVRAMPNTSATVGQSATAIASNEETTDEQLKRIATLFRSIGTVTFVPEDQLHVVTGISGSGPAYLYYLAEALQEKATQLHLNEKTANELIVQTFIGVAEMLKESKDTPKQLRLQVTSPGGTTEAGIQALINHHFKEAIYACVESAVGRSQQLESLYDR